MLTMESNTVIQIIQKLNDDEKYLFGYWRHETVAFATDAYVFDELLQDFYPKVRAHFQKVFLFPETFCQKWFVGLCIHVLPFDALFKFFDAFFEHGYIYLFKFGLSLIQHVHDSLLATSDISLLYSILRLDPVNLLLTDELALSIVTKALSYDLSKYNIKELRISLFETKLKERLKKANFKDQEEDDDDEEDDDEDEEGYECQVCENLAPDFVCTVCGKLLCEECQSAKHDKSHNVKPFDEKSLDKQFSKLKVKD